MDAAIDENHAVVVDLVAVDALVIVVQALVACPRFHAAVLFENLFDLRGITVFATGILRKPTMEGMVTATKTAIISTSVKPFCFFTGILPRFFHYSLFTIILQEPC